MQTQIQSEIGLESDCSYERQRAGASTHGRTAARACCVVSRVTTRSKIATSRTKIGRARKRCACAGITHARILLHSTPPPFRCRT
eukprot:183488-Pleurochrysis_carterae.AAC.2